MWKNEILKTGRVSKGVMNTRGKEIPKTRGHLRGSWITKVLEFTKRNSAETRTGRSNSIWGLIGRGKQDCSGPFR